MGSTKEVLKKIDDQIVRSDQAICRHIESLDVLGRGAVSQDILTNLRTFVEHIMLKVYAFTHDVEYHYGAITEAIKFVKTQGQYNFLSRFHAYLQIVASHYTLEPQDSERIMLKYYVFMLKIKKFLKAKFGLNVLSNLNKFPLNTDNQLQDYYEKIAQKIIDNKKGAATPTGSERYYIQKIKPFFVNRQIFYEVTFYPVMDKTNKNNRLIAFTTLEISNFYAVKLWTLEDKIELLGKNMPVLIITKWQVSIRPIEIERFSNIFKEDIKNCTKSGEYKGLMKFLTSSGFNLVELVSFHETYYSRTRDHILEENRAKSHRLFTILDQCRTIILKNQKGCNLIRYMLYHMNYAIIKKQLDIPNDRLSGLCLANGCIPFDEMPFCTSLMGHNPRLRDLFDCIDPTNRMHEILARYIMNNTEIDAQLYTPKTEVEGLGDIDLLVRAFNAKLYKGHPSRRICKRNQHLFIAEYENDTLFILKEMIRGSTSKVENFSEQVDKWLHSGQCNIDCEEKKQALRHMFLHSVVALIYGAAGTGKSTMINHISNLFLDESKLYLANTNPAVDNMKRRVTARSSDADFMTITKFLKRQRNRTDYDMIVIDECSTVSNKDMRKILEKARFKILVLVGDVYQIESIRFGNWFSVARSFLPDTAVFELRKPYRSHSVQLQQLWDKVRGMDDTTKEYLAKNQYSFKLDESIFEPAGDDEIILCLNYDGLYGINNINRFLQEANPNPAVSWGLQLYKIGDPILFNDSDRFVPVIYNNVKGRIVDIHVIENKICFDIAVEKSIKETEGNEDLMVLKSGSSHSMVRFTVDDYRTVDENSEVPDTAIVPFQVSYAVSIHKAQGLEYESVKIVITDEIEDHITHSIFYTAITRAKSKLKIYWSPEVEEKIISRIKPKDNEKDVFFLKQAMTEA